LPWPPGGLDLIAVDERLSGVLQHTPLHLDAEGGAAMPIVPNLGEAVKGKLI